MTKSNSNCQVIRGPFYQYTHARNSREIISKSWRSMNIKPLRPHSSSNYLWKPSERSVHFFLLNKQTTLQNSWGSSGEIFNRQLSRQNFAFDPCQRVTISSLSSVESLFSKGGKPDPAKLSSGIAFFPFPLQRSVWAERVKEIMRFWLGISVPGAVMYMIPSVRKFFSIFRPIPAKLHQ